MMSEFEPFHILTARQEKVKEQTERTFQEHCKIIENGIAFSTATRGLILIKGNRLSAKQSTLWAFFHRNFFYLLSAYQDMQRGLLHPAYASIRVVLESIILGYAFVCKNDIWLHYEKMIGLEQKKFESVKQENQELWTVKNEKELIEMRKKHTILKIFSCIYTPKSQKKIEEQAYWLLSHRSHPSTFGLNYNAPDLAFDEDFYRIKKQIEDGLNVVIYSSSANLLFFLESFFDSLDENEREKIFEEINKLNRFLGSKPNLIPDKEECREILKIKIKG